ncbi:hypothetical protein GMORB2_3174 [Geosmithia morbida]|uniref:Uncharacterized protein n=1 Tax=Geosmithia morbida TaxID=1094350 RepID=A0A9P4YRH7_9HYPO|nr:uncharacterized protein GMORB2_3174 [Geosmithia morbida]KAF4120373.1 hypothetical protein GMORB2_3174 [Geosmithia morbida]
MLASLSLQLRHLLFVDPDLLVKALAASLALLVHDQGLDFVARRRALVLYKFDLLVHAAVHAGLHGAH